MEIPRNRIWRYLGKDMEISRNRIWRYLGKDMEIPRKGYGDSLERI